MSSAERTERTERTPPPQTTGCKTNPRRPRVLSEETRRRKRESNRINAQTRICIGSEMLRWRELKEEEGFTTDAALALMLLDDYEQRQLCSTAAAAAAAAAAADPPHQHHQLHQLHQLHQQQQHQHHEQQLHQVQSGGSIIKEESDCNRGTEVKLEEDEVLTDSLQSPAVEEEEQHDCR